MAEGNGADLGSIAAMLQTLVIASEETNARLGRLEARFDGFEARLSRVERQLVALSQEVGILKRDVGTLRQDVGSLRHDVGTLRQEVSLYHGSTVGHGIMLTELDDRLRRLEHQVLPPAA